MARPIPVAPPVGDALIDTVTRWATGEGAETVELSVKTSKVCVLDRRTRNGRRRDREDANPVVTVRCSDAS